MTIAQIATSANNQGDDAPASSWGQPKETSCHYVQTEYENGRVVQRWHPCRRVDCSYCGPRKKEADLTQALRLFSGETATISIVLVPSWKVDHLRKLAGRHDQPILSVPVAEDRNAIFSPYAFEGSHVPDEEEIRQVFMSRVPRRKLTRTGRWKPKSSDRKSDVIVLTKEFVGPEAFRNVAQRLGAKLRYTDTETFFEDEWNHGPEQYKKWLIEEEHRVRRIRLKARGWGWARRFKDRAA